MRVIASTIGGYCQLGPGITSRRPADAVQVHRTARAGLPIFSPPGAVTAYRSPDGQTELDALAMAVDGLRWVVEIKWRSKAAGDKELVARVALATGPSAVSALAEATPKRHTNRSAYDLTRPVVTEVFEHLKALGSDLADVTVFWFTTPERKQVGDLIVQATEALAADEQQSIDSHIWYRET
jgi:hypothetical protein